MKFFLQLSVGVLLWAVLSIGGKTIRAAAHRGSRLQGIPSFMPAFSFIAWLLYALWIVHSWLSGSPLYPFIMFLCFALLATLFVWFVLRDVIAGTVVSCRKQFPVNHRIRFTDLSGKIIARGVTHITVRTDNGDIARIPYSRLSGEIVPERPEETASDYFRIHLIIPKKGSPEELQSILTRDVRSIPWAAGGTAPIVQLKEQTEDTCNFEILFKCLNSRHAARVERILRNKYSSRELHGD